MSSLVDELVSRFPGRKKQIKQLYSLFGYEDEPFVDCVYVHGPSSSGKTCVLTAVLNALNIRSARINLIECCTSKMLFESILNQLAGHKIDAIKAQPYAKCDNMMDFLFNLTKCASRIDLGKPVIVFDKAEQLRNMESNLLPVFLRFREVSRLDISVILVSELVFERYYSKSVVDEPIKIHFPQYNQDELLNILNLDFDQLIVFVKNNCDCNDKIEIITSELYQGYLNLFLSVFYRACRDLTELRHMSRINFVDYCAPLLKGECKVEDSMALWRHIAPILKSSLEVIYLRLSRSKDSSEGNNRQPAFSKENLAHSLELPYYAKYLLIAAYLASYNPAKEDKRLFVKYHGKKKKRMQDVRAKHVVSEVLNTQMGPKAFTFERLVAIFYAILEEKVDFNSSLLAQITTMVELQLLSIVSDNCDLQGRKYKCCVGLEFVQVIGKTLDFNIRKYLVDFN